MKTTTRLPSQTKTTNELAIHYPWGLAKSYYPSSTEAYEVAEAMTKAGYTVSLRIG